MAPSGPPPSKAAAAAPKEVKKKVEKKKVVEEDAPPKVPVPDRAAMDEKLQKIQDGIDKKQKEQAELTKEINGRSGGKDDFFTKKNELRGQLNEFSDRMNELKAKKDEILKVIGDKKQQGQEMKAELGKMKKSLGYSSEADIDDRIRQIESQMMHESVSIKVEKQYLEEIKQLKKSKPKITQVAAMESSVSTHDSGAQMKEKIGVINEEMSKYFEGKKAISAKLTELMEGRKAQLGDMPDLIEKRDTIGKAIQEFIKERNTIRDEFRVQEREYNAALAEVRKARAERSAVERAERDKEYQQRRLEREAEKLDDQPHVAEIVLIEQTILFCQTLTKGKEEEKKVEKKEIAHGAMDGIEICVKKEDREEYYYAPTAKGKKGKAKKSVADAADGKGKPIKHNAETFRLFDQLKLDAPITTADIPALLEKLEVQLKDYQEKVKVWELKREEMKKAILEGGVLPSEEKKEEEKEEAKEEAKEEEKKEDE